MTCWVLKYESDSSVVICMIGPRHDISVHVKHWVQLCYDERYTFFITMVYLLLNLVVEKLLRFSDWHFSPIICSLVEKIWSQLFIFGGCVNGLHFLC